MNLAPLELVRPAGIVGVDEILNQARQMPELQTRLDENFAELDAMLPPPDPEHSEMVRKYLSKWKPIDGKPK